MARKNGVSVEEIYSHGPVLMRIARVHRLNKVDLIRREQIERGIHGHVLSPAFHCEHVSLRNAD